MSRRYCAIVTSHGGSAGSPQSEDRIELPTPQLADGVYVALYIADPLSVRQRLAEAALQHYMLLGLAEWRVNTL